MSAVNSTARGASPSSGFASAHASSGAASSSPAPATVVVVGPPAAVGAAATVVGGVGVFGVSFGAPPPPPQPTSPSRSARASEIGHTGVRIMHCPPWWGSERPRILTDGPWAVKRSGVVGGLVLLVLTALPGAARAAVPTHGELRLLAVLAQFPDHPLANERAHFVGGADALVDRLVGYYTEVSAGRLTIVPTVG